MVTPSRRALLQGAAAAAVGIAGCQTSSSGTSRTSDPLDAENVETDPERRPLRHTENAPVVWLSTGTTTSPPTTDREPRISERETGLIANQDTADRVRFANVDRVEEAREFVDDTDFHRETILLESRIVPECYQLELCALTWSSTDYHTYFGRTLRPADVACRVERSDRLALLIRIPDVLDPEQVRSRGSGTSSGSCWKFRHRLERLRTERAGRTTDGNTSGSGGGGPR